MTQVIDITNYVTDIYWSGDNLVADAQVDDDDEILTNLQGVSMSMSLTVDQIDYDLFEYIFGYRRTNLSKMHADYRRKTRRRNRR